jgi:predicted MFS family arabinose efflux permease
MAYSGFFGCIIFLPRLAQESFGFSPGRAGLLLIPLTIGMMIAGNVGGRVAGRTRRFRLAGSSGFCLAAIGALVLAAATRSGSVLGVVAGELLMGLGVGFTLPVYNMASQFAFPLSTVGLVTALIEFFQDLGGAVGSSVLGAIAATAPGAAGRGESLAFVASAIVLAAGAALMWRLDEAAVVAGMDAQGMNGAAAGAEGAPARE